MPEHVPQSVAAVSKYARSGIKPELCCYPRRERGTPLLVVLWCDGRDIDAVMGDQCSNYTGTSDSSRSGTRAYHFVVPQNGNSIELLPVEFLALTELTESGALCNADTGVDEECIHIGILQCGDCQVVGAGSPVGEAAAICCKLKEVYPDIKIVPAAIFFPDIQEQEELSGRDAIFAEIIRLTNDDCESVLAGHRPVLAIGPQRPVGQALSACDSCEDACYISCEEIKAGLAASGAGLADLESLVIDLQAQVVAQQATIGNLNTTLLSLTEQVAAMLPVASEVQLLKEFWNQYHPCIECICPLQVADGIIEYRLDGGSNPHVIVPNVTRRINFATKVTDLNPEVVQVGGLWSAVSLPIGNHLIEVEVVFEQTEVCAGCQFWLDIIHCGERTRIATQTMTLNGPESPMLSYVGNLTVTNLCPDTYFEVGTNCNTGVPAFKRILSAVVRIH